jgi:hypothetical protein
MKSLRGYKNFNNNKEYFMGDFHQNGIITTLHNLSRRPVEDLDEELLAFSKTRPLGLILPSLFSELEGAALPLIVDELKHVPYLNQVVIGLDRANESEYRHALDFFAPLPQHQDFKPLTKSFRRWIWRQKSSARVVMSGIAWAMFWHPIKPNLSPYMIAT